MVEDRMESKQRVRRDEDDEREAAARDRRSDQLFRRDGERAQALAQLSGKLAEVLGDTQDVLDSVVTLVAEFLGDTAVLRLLSDDDDSMKVAAMHDADPGVRERMEAMLQHRPAELQATQLYDRAIREARTVILAGPAFVDAMAKFPPASRAALRELDVRATLLCPLRARGQVIGTLGLWRRGERPAHSLRDQEFAQELADRAALAIDNARLIERLRTEVEHRTRTEQDMQLSSELLRRGEANRRVLMGNLVAAEEEQRRRIAVDVHDDSIQAMAAMSLRLQVLRRHAPSAEFAEKIADIEDTVVASISRLRRLLFQLDSAALHEVGLARALSRYLDETFPDEVPRKVFRTRLEQEPSAQMRTILYRIAQEALNNVRKHASAKKVTVVVAPHEGGVLVSIEDDGKGFNVDDVSSRSLPGHLGLRSMLERATVADGWLTVDSTPGEGTTLRVWLPTPTELNDD
jgi:signal transduction histidine kinase